MIAVTAEGVPEIVQFVLRLSPVGSVGEALQLVMIPPVLTGFIEEIAVLTVATTVEGE